MEGNLPMAWIRVSRSSPCVVCGKPDWCGRASSDDHVVYHRCMRERGDVPGLRCIKDDTEGRTYITTSDSLRDGGGAPCRQPHDKHPAVTAKAAVNWASACKRFTRAFTRDRVASLSRSIGVSEMAMSIVGVGWCTPQMAYTMPMRDATGKVIGVRLRRLDGSKLSIRGSKNGVFCSSELATKPKCGLPIMVCEGPTDAMAMMDLGFWSLGRPSCRGATNITKRLCRGHPVVVVADRDTPGREGAALIAGVLDEVCPSVKVIEPAAGKDAREWLGLGASMDSVRLIVDAAKEWVA